MEDIYIHNQLNMIISLKLCLIVSSYYVPEVEWRFSYINVISTPSSSSVRFTYFSSPTGGKTKYQKL